MHHLGSQAHLTQDIDSRQTTQPFGRSWEMQLEVRSNLVAEIGSLAQSTTTMAAARQCHAETCQPADVKKQAADFSSSTSLHITFCDVYTIEYDI